MKVVISDDPICRPFDYEQQRLSALGIDVAFSDPGESAIRRAAAEAEVLFSLGAPLSRETLDALPACQLIVFYGTGADSIDMPAATELGIVVANTPLFGYAEVADHALAMLLMCSRRLADLDRAVRRGNWDWDPFRDFHSLSSQTVGIMGFGHIGQAMARRLHALECRIVYFDPYVPTAPFDYVTPASLEQLLQTSDYVTIHAPLTKETAGSVGEAQVRLMKPTAYLINTARGAIVDERALVQALTAHRIAGAALDVFATEPLPEGHPLLTLPNVVLSPHIAGYTVESHRRIRETACDAVEQLLRGEWPRHVVNRAVQPRAAALRADKGSSQRGA